MLYDLTKNYLVEKAKTKKEKTAFYITDNSKCNRQIWYELKNTPCSNYDNYEALRRFDAGNKIEDGLVEMWKDMGILVDRQIRVDVPLNEFHDIHGYADALIEIANYRHVVEVKSFYGYWQSKEMRENGPKDSYVKQLGLYIYFLKDVVKDLSNVGYLYVEDRADATTYEFVIEVKENVLDGYEIWCNNKCYGTIPEILNKWNSISKKLMIGELPAAQFQYKYPLDRMMTELSTKEKSSWKAYFRAMDSGQQPPYMKVCGDWQCVYCQYKDKCIEEQGIGLGYRAEELVQIKTKLS